MKFVGGVFFGIAVALFVVIQQMIDVSTGHMNLAQIVTVAFLIGMGIATSLFGVFVCWFWLNQD